MLRVVPNDMSLHEHTHTYNEQDNIRAANNHAGKADHVGRGMGGGVSTMGVVISPPSLERVAVFSWPALHITTNTMRRPIRATPMQNIQGKRNKTALIRC